MKRAIQVTLTTDRNGNKWVRASYGRRYARISRSPDDRDWRELDALVAVHMLYRKMDWEVQRWVVGELDNYTVIFVEV